MIQLQVIGNLGRDAEIKEFGGVKYASFSVCHTEKRGDKEFSTWVNCLKRDENGKLAPYLTKGSKVYVSGSPRANAYSSNGEAKADLQLTVFNLEFCGSKGQATDNSNHEYVSGDANAGSAPAPTDDLPF